MKETFWVVGLVLLGCGGTNDDPKGGSGGEPAIAGQAGMSAAAGASAGGVAGLGPSSAGSGGAIGGSVNTQAGNGGAICEARWAEYEPLAQSARACDPSAATPECSISQVVLDRCGCSVPANPSQPDFLKANRLITKYVLDCEYPEKCAGCPASVNAGCATSGTGISQCVYQ